MKKIHTLSIVSVIAILLTIWSFKGKEASGQGILTIQTTETLNVLGNNSMTIVDEFGRQEKKELRNLRLGDLSSNQKIITSQLNLISAKGYHLKATNSVVLNEVMVTTYIFAKY